MRPFHYLLSAKRNTARTAACSLALAATLALPLLAQTTTARLTGIVTDPSGAVIANATVRITNHATGEVRTVTTNGNGLFVAVSLPPAAYDVAVTAAGFSSSEQKNLVLAVGQELSEKYALPLAGADTMVTVNAGSLIDLDESSAKIGANITGREIQQLPINGRQISQLYLLVPGATNSGAGTFDTIRFSGRAVEENILRIDGIDAGSIISQSPGNLNGEITSQFRLQQSLEAVQEFRVDSSNYPAELGTGTGGQISFVTKSGTNSLHGSVFEYVRNDFFDARNYFNRRNTLGNSPKFRLNQFGGTVGGPIIRDKLFFFATYEGLRQSFPSTFVGGTLRQSDRTTIAATRPALIPLLAAFPIANTTDATGVLSRITNTGQNTINENFGDIRFDYKFNDRFSMYARYNRDQGVSNQVQDASLSQFGQVEVPQNGVLAVNQVLSPRIFNESKFGFNGTKQRVLGIAGPSPNADLSRTRIAISGLTNVGSLISLSSSFNGVGAPYTGSEYSYIDNLSIVRGNHNLKFGVEFRPRQLYNDQIGGTTYTYPSVAAFIANAPTQIQFFGNLSDLSPFTGLSGNALVKQTFYIGYAQDEWKIKPNLTLNFGLRYEYYSALHENRNKDVFFNIPTGNIVPKYSGDWFHSNQNNFGPRLALTYAPAAMNNKTVLRLGAGTYYGPGQTEDQIQPEANDRVSRTFTNTANPGVIYPLNPQTDVYATYDINSPTLGYQPRAYAPTYKVPERVTSYTASIQQELPGNMQLLVGYVGSSNRNLFLRSVTNLITNVTTSGTTGAGTVTRQFGNRFAEVDYKTSGGTDQYHSLQTSLQRRFTSGLSLGAQYTWAHELGTSSGSNEANTAQQPLQLFGARPEFGRGTFDIRHSLNITTLYGLPFGKGKAYSLSGPLDTVAGGWQLGGILNFRSGLPIDVLIQRNDVAYVGQVGPYTGRVFANPVIDRANCPAFTSNGAVYANGLCTLAVQNVPYGGNSRNIRRPNIVPGVNPFLKQGLQFLNPAAFTTPAPGTFGNSRRNNLSGPNLAQLDLTLQKEFGFTEQVRLKFQSDIYNVLNHPNFANPGTVRLPFNLPTNAAGLTSTTAVQPGQAFTTTTANNGFGQITSTVNNQVGIGDNRQIQLSLRLLF